MKLKLTIRPRISETYREASMILRGYQPTTNTGKGEKGDMFTSSHSILFRWRNYFSQLFNVHGVNNFRQTEIHAAEPLGPECSAFEIEVVKKTHHQVWISLRD